MQPPDACLGSQLKDLVILLGDLAGDTLTLAAGLQAARAVPATALHQEAARPEDGVGPLQLLPDRHREVAGRAAVEPHLLLEQVQVHHSGFSSKHEILAQQLQRSGPVEIF